MNESSTTIPATTAPSSPNYRQTKYGVLIALVLLSYLYGAALAYFFPGLFDEGTQDTSILDVLFGLTSAILIFVWYRLDAEQRGYRRSGLLNFTVFFVTVIALPYYFFKSRGAEGGVIACVLACLVWVATVIAIIAGILTVEFRLS